MRDVDFERLSQQYGGFLVAVGGVSITVLTLVLKFYQEPTPPQNKARLFLVPALIVAAVCCFVGAHMMAETSAFFSRLKECLPRLRSASQIALGQRLFVIATANIFIGITLVLFAVVLLPTATGTANLSLITSVVFVSVALGSLVWMFLASIDRVVAVDRDGWKAIGTGVYVGIVFGVLCRDLPMDLLPGVIFIFIDVFTLAAVIYFAFTFKLGWACNRIHCLIEIGSFGAAITFSNISLIVAHFRIVCSG